LKVLPLPSRQFVVLLIVSSSRIGLHVLQNVKRLIQLSEVCCEHLVTICTTFCNIQRLSIIPVYCVYGFNVVMRTNNVHFSIKHYNRLALSVDTVYIGYSMSSLRNELNFRTLFRLTLWFSGCIDTENKHHIHRQCQPVTFLEKRVIKIFDWLWLNYFSLGNEKAQFKVALRG
jgi:hypothetical protein